MASILIHTLVFPPDAITNGYLLSDLAREFHQQYGHEVTILTTTPHYNIVDDDLRKQPMTPIKGDWLLQSTFEGVIPCYHIRVPPVKGDVGTRMKTALRFHIKSLQALRYMGRNFDVVISQSPPLSIGLIGSMIARRCKAKSIYIVQDIFPDGLIRQGKIRNKFLIAALKLLERIVYRSNSAICGISKGFGEILRPRVPKRNQVAIIPNFVNADIYRPLPRDNEYAREHGLDKRFVVSYVGNIGNAQDFTPVMAAARACADLPVQFLLVGDGIKRASLVEEVQRDQLKNVEIPGYLPREVTPWINASSDLTLVLLAPHVGQFGFPSKVFTLMASGRPIVLVGDPASDIAQLITTTGTGWVVKSGDTEGVAALIRRLYHDRAELEACAQRGRQVVLERFTVHTIARQYNDLIESLLGKHETTHAATNTETV